MQIFSIQSIDGENNSFEPISGKKKDGLQGKVLMICLEVLHQQYNPYESSAGNTEGFNIILTHVSWGKFYPCYNQVNDMSLAFY